MLASTAIVDRNRPLSEEDRLSHLVDDIITLNAEGAATRGRLYELGWSNPFLDENLGRATQLANQRFVRQVDDEPVRSLADVERDMSDVIISLLPPTQRVVAELQSRGMSKAHIDLLLPKARARAALDFAHGAH